MSDLKTELDAVRECWEQVDGLNLANQKLKSENNMLIDEVARLGHQKNQADISNKYLDQKLVEAKFNEASVHQKEEECTKLKTALDQLQKD